MGKIQDAILRVRRDRKVSVSKTAPAAELTSTPGLHSDLAASDQSVDEGSWDYGGHKIAIGREKLINAGLLDPDHLRKHLSNEYRQLKKTLLANITSDSESGEGRRNLIMVGSAEHGEGKSFLSLNLAMSLASEPGHTVVLVDSDTGNPRISELLCTADASGFTDLLADPSLDVMQVISPTDMPGLAVLPAGKTRGQAGEIAGSDQAAEMFESLTKTMSEYVHVGELKRPQPPWPHGLV